MSEGIERDAILFYRSFYEAIKRIPDPTIKAEAYEAIIGYGITGEMPDCTGFAESIFYMAKPQIDANNKKYLNGLKGGKPQPIENQLETKTKPSDNQDVTKQEPSDNQDVTKAEAKEKRIKNKEKRIKNNNIYCPADNSIEDESDADSVEDKSDAIPYKDIIDYLNARTGSHYLHKSKNSREKIRARWNEGFRLDDFKAVIDNTASRWEKDSKMSDYLRPETLFSPKFESYLNLKPVAEAKPANRFHNFEQRDEIDFDALEAQLDSQLARDLGGMP